MQDKEGLGGFQVLSADRLGRLRDDRNDTYCRPVRVTCSNVQLKWRILKKSKGFTNSKNGNENIFIDLDLTKKERLKDKELRKELKARKENGEDNLVIKKGVIVDLPRSKFYVY